ncbi:hypothetical protein [Natrinema sp. SYSU A 869]|nr:hypothetical protein [Natrinema sp. SYSU A 869]
MREFDLGDPRKAVPTELAGAITDHIDVLEEIFSNTPMRTEMGTIGEVI